MKLLELLCKECKQLLYLLFSFLEYLVWIAGFTMLLAMPMFERSGALSIEMPNDLNFAFHFPTFLKIYMLAFLPGDWYFSPFSAKKPFSIISGLPVSVNALHTVTNILVFIYHQKLFKSTSYKKRNQCLLWKHCNCSKMLC